MKKIIGFPGRALSMALLATFGVAGCGGSKSGDNISALAAGEKRSLVLQPDGTIWAWGSNGRYGLGTTVEYIPSSSLPAPVLIP